MNYLEISGGIFPGPIGRDLGSSALMYCLILSVFSTPQMNGLGLLFSTTDIRC